jgi:tRNA (mo5U34)-methyltransferase
MEREGLRERVFSRSWFHRIDLGGGIVTPGIDDSPSKLTHIHLPVDLSGKSVLDIGAYDGFFSFEAERRGAARVLATDHFCWTRWGMGDGKGFQIAHEALRSRVEAKVVVAEELSPETVGTFDIVLFLGVLYHSPDPLRYLRAARSVCKEMMIIETHVDALDYPRPAMVFYPGTTLNNDPSNFWGPNIQCVEELLKEVGFRRLVIFPPYHPSRIVVHAFVEE